MVISVSEKVFEMVENKQLVGSLKLHVRLGIRSDFQNSKKLSSARLSSYIVRLGSLVARKFLAGPTSIKVGTKKNIRENAQKITNTWFQWTNINFLFSL